jgi:hypothetical protein
MFVIRAWSHISPGVTKGHVNAVLMLNDTTYGTSVNRLRREGYLALDRQTGYLTITKEGVRKMYRLQGRRSNIWGRMKEYTDKNRLEHIQKLNNARNQPNNSETE